MKLLAAATALAAVALSGCTFYYPRPVAPAPPPPPRVVRPAPQVNRAPQPPTAHSTVPLQTGQTCELDQPVKINAHNEITNRDCFYYDANGRLRSLDPWIDDQLTNPPEVPSLPPSPAPPAPPPPPGPEPSFAPAPPTEPPEVSTPSTSDTPTPEQAPPSEPATPNTSDSPCPDSTDSPTPCPGG